MIKSCEQCKYEKNIDEECKSCDGNYSKFELNEICELEYCIEVLKKAGYNISLC